MKITGSVRVPHPVEEVWDAILDPAVLVATIPGCSRLETVAENSYAMTVSAGVAAIRGTYDGTAVLSDLQPGRSLVMRLTGAGAPGTVDATVDVSLAAVEEGTEVSYGADATVGGMVGGVGQRMLTSVSKRMAAEFFRGVGEAIGSRGLDTPPPSGSGYSTSDRGSGYSTSEGVRGSSASASEPVRGSSASASERIETPTVFTPPARRRERDDLLTGIAIGAGLVLVGVAAGRWLGRGR